MNKLWQWVMRLNAKAFRFVASGLFVATALWCGFRYLTPVAPFQEGKGDSEGAQKVSDLDTLDFVSNQVSETGISIPIDPFRPTIEAIFTNETERAAFLKALKAAQAAAAGVTPANGAGSKDDPFAGLRKKNQVPGQLVGPNGQPMVKPKITFLGFMERPDGTKAALFGDSVDKSTFFYEPGKKVHGAEILSADINEVTIRLPDGTTCKRSIGGSVDLAAEPAKAPAPVKKDTAAAAKTAAPKAGVAADKKAGGNANAAANKAGGKAAAGANGAKAKVAAGANDANGAKAKARARAAQQQRAQKKVR